MKAWETPPDRNCVTIDQRGLLFSRLERCLRLTKSRCDAETLSTVGSCQEEKAPWGHSWIQRSGDNLPQALVVQPPHHVPLLQPWMTLWTDCAGAWTVLLGQNRTVTGMTAGYLIGFWVFHCCGGEDRQQPLFHQLLHAECLQAALVPIQTPVPSPMLFHSGCYVDCDWMGFEVGSFHWCVCC